MYLSVQDGLSMRITYYNYINYITNSAKLLKCCISKNKIWHKLCESSNQVLFVCCSFFLFFHVNLSTLTK